MRVEREGWVRLPLGVRIEDVSTGCGAGAPLCEQEGPGKPRWKTGFAQKQGRVFECGQMQWHAGTLAAGRSGGKEVQGDGETFHAKHTRPAA